MRHKYVTDAIVLARTPLAESAALLTLLTEELGMLYARADGVRRPGAKLAHALQTLDRAEVTVMRGKEGWRLSGAIPHTRIFDSLSRSARIRAARVTGLFARLLRGEASDPEPYGLYLSFLESLPDTSEELQDAAECLVALKLLAHLGLDAGSTIDDTLRVLSPLERREIVTRINRGLNASGL